jgi:hypothetical protein
MAKWVEYDRRTGLHETNVTLEDENKLIVRKVENVQGLLDRNAELRATNATDKGIQKGFWWYCSIPITVQYELLSKYGLNIHNKNHTDRIFDVINRDFPALKVTQKIHSRSRNLSRTKADTTKPGDSPNTTSSTSTLIVVRH